MLLGLASRDSSGCKMTDEFERFLTRDAALSYNIKRFSVRWIIVEAMGGKEALSVQMTTDMLHSDRLQNAVAQSLAVNRLGRPEVAKRWAAFLKMRVEVLEYWSSFVGAIGALLVGGGGIIAIVNGWPWFAAVGAAIGGVAVGVCKFEIDRKKLWYRFLVTSLSEIK